VNLEVFQNGKPVTALSADLSSIFSFVINSTASSTFSLEGTSKESSLLNTVNGKMISLYFPLTKTSLNTSSAILQMKLTIRLCDLLSIQFF